MLMASLTACGGKGENATAITVDASEISEISEDTKEVKANKKENKIKKVNYSLLALKEKYDYDDTGYKYEISGTSLTDHVETSKDYGEQVINKENIFNSLLEVESVIPVVPDNTVKTNTEHVLNHTFKKENMLQMNDDAVMTRLDIEMARMINDGVYMVGINDIEYYSKDELNRE